MFVYIDALVYEAVYACRQHSVPVLHDEVKAFVRYGRVPLASRAAVLLLPAVRCGKAIAAFV